MRAIVLSGGGARGAYQIGVWKALKRLKIDYDIVTGTSIGSINGLMMVQRDYYKTLWLWKNIDFDVIYDADFPNKYDSLLQKTQIYKEYAKHFFKNGGISMGKMKHLLERVYNKRKFFKSNINYGLVTFNLSKMEPVCIKKDELKDDIIDYVLASACCYPAFQKKEINGEKYIDGGFYDNMPINMAIDMGADEVIAIDLDTIGIKQDVKDKNVKITYISPKNDIGAFLVFDKKLAMRAIKYGYYDTMKLYKELDGDKYTFKKGNLYSNYNKYSKKFLQYCDNLFSLDEGIYYDILKLSLFNRILKTKREYELRKIMNETVEFLGKLFDVDSCKIYDIKNYNKNLLEKNRKQESISKKILSDKIKNKDFRDLLNTRTIIKYLYNSLDKKPKDLCILASLFPKEFLGAIYLKIIK